MKLMLLTKVLPAVALVIGAQSISACGDINGDGNQAKGKSKQNFMIINEQVRDAHLVQGDGNNSRFKESTKISTKTTNTTVTANTKVKLF
jgi:hypothetical protein